MPGESPLAGWVGAERPGAAAEVRPGWGRGRKEAEPQALGLWVQVGRAGSLSRTLPAAEPRRCHYCLMKGKEVKNGPATFIWKAI